MSSRQEKREWVLAAERKDRKLRNLLWKKLTGEYWDEDYEEVDAPENTAPVVWETEKPS